MDDKDHGDAAALTRTEQRKRKRQDGKDPGNKQQKVDVDAPCVHESHAEHVTEPESAAISASGINGVIPEPKASDAALSTRRILFVGNLPYNVTPEDVRQHFHCLDIRGDIVSVRIPTEKGTGNPKGFAFLEVASSQAVTVALRMQGSSLGGRKINVELTAGGGGASSQRKKKIAKKNEQVRLALNKRTEAMKNPDVVQEKLKRRQEWKNKRRAEGIGKPPATIPDEAWEEPKQSRGGGRGGRGFGRGRGGRGRGTSRGRGSGRGRGRGTGGRGGRSN